MSRSRNPEGAAGSQPYLIPKVVIQTAPSADLPPAIVESRRRMQEENPGWRFELYDDDAVVEFIRGEYGGDVLKSYLSIHPSYGAARADLFRYLRIYNGGGIYLDIKSLFIKPIEQNIYSTDQLVLCHWSNGPGQMYEGFGLHPDVSDVPGGEFQQWHVIAAPKHPLMEIVVDQVLQNIRTYRPWRFGVSRPGVFRVTGPIAYTRALVPHLHRFPCRIVPTEADLGLQYSVLDGYNHLQHFQAHYSRHDFPVVALPHHARIAAAAYIAVRRLKHLLKSGRSNDSL
jgi:inositol phosphorylceramide mannosyltransferase catalytic subunit